MRTYLVFINNKPFVSTGYYNWHAQNTVLREHYKGMNTSKFKIESFKLTD